MVIKKKWFIIFLTNIYLVQVLGMYILMKFFNSADSSISHPPANVYFLLGLLLFSVLLAFLNVVNAILAMRRNAENTNCNSLGLIMGFKLGMIPFFISHMFWFLIFMGGTANPFLLILWAVIPAMFLIYAYIVLLATSSYSILQIVKLSRSNVLTKKQCVFHIIMQLLFFADVIDAVYLFCKYRKSV